MKFENNIEAISFYGVVTLSFSIKLVAISVLSISPEADYLAYWNLVTSLLETGVMNDGNGNVAFFNSGYPLFLAPFLYIFGQTQEVAQVVNTILGGLSTVLLYCCARIVLKNHIYALIACLLWGFYPPNILYTEYLAKENLVIPLLLSQMYLILTYRGTWIKTFLLGVVFATGMLSGSAILFTVLPIVYVILSLGKSSVKFSQASIIRLCFFGLVFLLTMSPWLAYTKSQLGVAVITTNSGFNLYIGNNPNSTPHFISITDTPMADTWHALKKEKGEFESFAYLKKLAVDHIIENPLSTLSLALQKVVLFWEPPPLNRHLEQPIPEKVIRVAWLAYYCVLFMLALSSLFLIKNFKREHYLVLSIIVLFCAIHGAVYVAPRYRLPIMPLVVLVGTYALSWFINSYVQFQNRRQ
ncbi:hypothetical protein MTsDn5_17490 [Alteromonas gracilis]|uniref:glycosyltransferase family 39 protein n=1 Tax=Alteromonas gracilis TaxID=1479524 RepID=UPI0036F2B012